MKLLAHTFFLAFTLLDFLHNFSVSASECDHKPIFSPPRLILQYGDPVSVECAVCPQDCPTPNFGVETPLGEVTGNGSSLSWTVDSMTEWDSRITCFYEKSAGGHCETVLNLTVYQPPKNVSISFVENFSEMVEDQEYTLQCGVHDVAPVEKLQVTFYRDQTPLISQPPQGNDPKTPVNRTYTHKINASREDDGAKFWCEAKLELEADGPQPPPVGKSQKLTASVQYRPQLREPKPLKEITLVVGDALTLNCSAEGNPPPSYTWKLPAAAGLDPVTGSVLTVASVQSEHAGEYVCSVTNSVGAAKVQFHVDVRADHTVLIICIAIAIVGAIVILVVIMYLPYYRKHRMGRYHLKNVFRLNHRHDAVPLEA